MCPRTRDPPLWDLRDRRELAPANERTALEESVERLRWIGQRRLHHRLLLERRRWVRETVAILSTHAANAFGVVVPEMAAAIVEEVLNPQALLEQVHACVQ